MKPANLFTKNADIAKEKLTCCAECGWPGIGNMPAGVRTVNQNGSQLLIGQLSYFRIQTMRCSVCQEMIAAVENRPWFVEGHREYLKQIKAKKRLLAGR